MSATRENKFGMSAADYSEMRSWCRANSKNAGVLAWLDKNPPPASWLGSRLEFAWCEMPAFFVERR